MSQDHEFAEFLRTIGRGPRLSRPLDRAEAPAALRLVLEGRVDPVQLGAFPLVLRYRGETPEELAGTIEAARETFSGAPPGTPAGGTPAGGHPLGGTPAGGDTRWGGHPLDRRPGRSPTSTGRPMPTGTGSSPGSCSPRACAP